MAEQVKTIDETIPGKVDERNVNKYAPKTTEKQTLDVLFCQLGRQAQKITIDKGTTLGGLLKAQKVPTNLEVRVNKQKLNNEALLEESQIIVVVPDQIRLLVAA